MLDVVFVKRCIRPNYQFNICALTTVYNIFPHLSMMLTPNSAPSQVSSSGSMGQSLNNLLVAFGAALIYLL